MTIEGRDVPIIRSWIANARRWTDAVRNGDIESRRLITDLAVVQAVSQASPRRVLDIGCGEGWLSRALRERGIESIGIDGSAELVDAARAADPGGHYETMTYDELVSEPGRLDSPFDLAVANFALLGEVLAPLLRTLRSHLLAPGGAIVIQTLHPWTCPPPYADGWREERFTAFPEADWVPMPWYFRTLGSWASLLDAAGFGSLAIREPLHPSTEAPASLILVARAAKGLSSV